MRTDLKSARHMPTATRHAPGAGLTRAEGGVPKSWARTGGVPSEFAPSRLTWAGLRTVFSNFERRKLRMPTGGWGKAA